MARRTKNTKVMLRRAKQFNIAKSMERKNKGTEIVLIGKLVSIFGSTDSPNKRTSSRQKHLIRTLRNK